MDFNDLAKLVGAAVSVAQHGAELVEAVTEHVERSKAALSERDFTTLTTMLEQSHERTQAVAKRLDAKLIKVING